MSTYYEGKAKQHAPWIRLFALLLLCATLGVASGIGVSHAQEEHEEADGVILRNDHGEIIAWTWMGVANGEVQVGPGEMSDSIFVSFLASDSTEFIPDEPEFYINIEIDNLTLATADSLDQFVFKLNGGLEGMTNLRVCLWHIDHCDFTSANIELHVEEEHEEADGVVLRNEQGEVIAYTWMGVGFGEVEVGPKWTPSSSRSCRRSTEFIPDEPDFYHIVEIDNMALATADSLDQFVFKLNGGLEGMTNLRICLWHVDHCDFTSPNIELHVEEEHEEADGVVLRNEQGEVIAYTWMGAGFGEVEVGPGEMSDSIFVSFLSPDSTEFVPDEPDFYHIVEIDNMTLATADSLDQFAFKLNGLIEGSTNLRICLWHVDHCDFTSPNIELHVEEEHQEADGVVIRDSQGQVVFHQWSGVSTGELFIKTGEQSDSLFISFLAPDSTEFTEEDPDFYVIMETDNGAVVTADSLGQYITKLNGLTQGSTNVRVCLWHIDHCDFTSLNIPTTVSDLVAVPGPAQGQKLSLQFAGGLPNPFRNATVLSYTISLPAEVSIQAYDIQGRRVAEVFRGKQEAGSHTIRWEASGMRAGVYFVRVEVPGLRQTKKVVLSP